MRLTRRIKLQLCVFVVVSLIAGAVMSISYIGLPSLLFGIGRYTVTLELPVTGGLYPTGNVSYRGQEVGRVAEVRMTDTGVEAVLSLDSDIAIPADSTAQVHSRTAIGEQYVDFVPGPGPVTAVLRNGDVIPRDRASVPPDINALLGETNKGLEAIPGDNLQTVVDEGATALAGLGPDLARLVKGSTALAIDADANLPALTELIDKSAPVLDSQSATSQSIAAWASNMAAITAQVQQRDQDVRGLLSTGSATATEVRQLFDRLQPSLPLMLANLTGVTELAMTYNAGVEQFLVLIPQAVAVLGSALVPDLGVMTAYKGPFVTFDLNLNVPPPCMTGYLPPSQQRATVFEDYPDRPEGDLYCRVPQNSPFNVRGARNIPCVRAPGKRAPTAKMCNSDEQYVPLNDGYNWKGDPNATTTGQGVPQFREPSATPVAGAQPAVPAAPPPAAVDPGPVVAPIAFAEYDPQTGTYVGPDGNLYTQADLARDKPEQTWQSMVYPLGI
ncbi:MCE family protein [Mycolicibacterium sp.]|uniref:MCE family protein n=1 Tax=Mycolicibacterium sp. TaxID=2320850 RepID=UPI003D1139BA